jgi:Cys-rich protein (TIGR01571 family)
LVEKSQPISDNVTHTVILVLDRTTFPNNFTKPISLFRSLYSTTMSNEKQTYVTGQVVTPTVITVQATPMVVSGTVVSSGGAPGNAADSLIPYPNENKFHHSDCERCCDCGGDCCLAWWCPCVSLAHIASRVTALGTPFCMQFNQILLVGLGLWILDIILWNVGVDAGYTFKIFCIIVAMTLRGAVRQRLNIPGDNCQDFCCAWCCLPCVITQINGSLWKVPKENPGCQFNDNYAQMV